MNRLAAQCAALAGALAEQGVIDLVLAPPAVSGSNGAAPPVERLVPGQTDLPGALVAAAPGSRLVSHATGLVVERTADSLVAIAATTDAGRTIASAIMA